MTEVTPPLDPIPVIGTTTGIVQSGAVSGESNAIRRSGAKAGGLDREPKGRNRSSAAS